MTNLNFKYFDDGPLVLKEVTVRLTMGSRIGVVGRNGAGKSTWLGFELLIFQALIGFDDETNLQKRHPEILDGLSLSLSFFVPYKSYICVYICTDTTRSFS